MSLINRGRTEPCKDTLGGLKNIYLFKWGYYPFWLINVVEGVNLIKYPDTAVFKFEMVGISNNYEESLTDNNAYDQKLSVQLKKQTAVDTYDLSNYKNMQLGVVVEDYNGLFRVMGMSTGCRIVSINVVNGSAKSDFNGYQLEIEASERFKAPLFTDLNTAGFFINEVPAGDNNLITELGEFLVDELGNNLIYI